MMTETEVAGARVTHRIGARIYFVDVADETYCGPDIRHE